MAKRICRSCHDRFDVDDARFITDGWYGPGRYDWACNHAGAILCAKCVDEYLYVEPQLDEDGNEYEVDPEDIIYPGLND